MTRLPRFGHCAACGKWAVLYRPPHKKTWTCEACFKWVWTDRRRKWWINHFPLYRWYWLRFVVPQLERHGGTLTTADALEKGRPAATSWVGTLEMTTATSGHTVAKVSWTPKAQWLEVSQPSAPPEKTNAKKRPAKKAAPRKKKAA